MSVQVPIPETEQVPSPLDTNSRPFEHSFRVVLVVKIAVVFMVKILSRVVFPAVCIRGAHGLLDKPFSTGKSAVLREPAEPSISNASRDAANLTPVNSGFPTPTKLFFALGAFCAGCCSRQPVYKRLLPEAHHEEVAVCASFGLLTLSGGLCLPVRGF